jgi:phosphoribosyl 1,2-cyclic phosphate phosphodiesterase
MSSALRPGNDDLAKAAKSRLEWVGAVRPSRAILTHMDSSLDYRTLCAELPQGVEPGYHGMEVSL